jgi:glycosyltransferase involved in cell wall biosynthesis
VYHLADRIVAYTQDYAENGSIFLKRFRKKVNYILPPVKVNTRLKPMEWKTKQVIGYVGRIGWEKGLNYLLEAIPKLEKGLGDDFKIVLVGPYQEVAGDKSINRLKPLLEKYKSRVVLYGPIDHEKLGAFYKSCQCLVLPSINNLETFGIVQAEAMRCGCPVVASNLPGVRVPIKMTGMGKIAKVGDVDDLVKKIVTVIKRKRGGYYKESAIGLSQFNYLTTVEKYENILAVLE